MQTREEVLIASEKSSCRWGEEESEGKTQYYSMALEFTLRVAGEGGAG